MNTRAAWCRPRRPRNCCGPSSCAATSTSSRRHHPTPTSDKTAGAAAPCRPCRSGLRRPPGAGRRRHVHRGRDEGASGGRRRRTSPSCATSSFPSRAGHASARLPPSLEVPLRLALVATGVAVVSYDEHTLTLAWTAAGARRSGFASIDRIRPARNRHRPLTAAPLAAAQYATPVEFGVERCFIVRTVVQAGPVSVESEASPPVCRTPVDTFPPGRPDAAGRAAV